jgi:hypothetical protein
MLLSLNRRLALSLSKQLRPTLHPLNQLSSPMCRHFSTPQKATPDTKPIILKNFANHKSDDP